MTDEWVLAMRRLSELGLTAIAVGAVALLAVETVYLAIFTVVGAASTRRRDSCREPVFAGRDARPQEPWVMENLPGSSSNTGSRSR